MNLLSTKKHEAFQVNDIDIQTDSILKYYKGNLSLELGPTITQMDTTVTYEYNDDFEKVATKTPSEKQVPEITVQMSADGKEMLQYLQNASIVENNNINTTVFPLYQVKVETTDLGLMASTNLNKPVVTSAILNKDIFRLNVDFEKIMKQNQFPMVYPYFDNVLNLNLTGKRNDSKINIEGQVNLNNSDILAISQFLQ